MRSLLIMLFFVLSANAHETSGDCHHLIEVNSPISKLAEVGKLYYLVAGDPVVEESICIHQEDESFYNHYVQNLSKSKDRVSKEINGISFVDENPRLLDAFLKLTTKEELFSSEAETYSSKCKKVLCAAKEIFGDQLGPRLVYILDKYGLNGSHLSFKNTSPWTIKELELVINGLRDLPDGMLPIEKNRSLVRHLRGTTYAMYASRGNCVAANAELRFFDCWEIIGKDYKKVVTMSHELGHYIGDALDADRSNEWNEVSGWSSETTFSFGIDLYETTWSHGENSCFLSRYAQSNPIEDFAETFVSYRYKADILKKECPKKYTYMKEHIFNGIEFTKDKDFCDNRKKYIKSEKQRRMDKIFKLF